MRFGQIRHVNVIPDAGTVRRIVIVAEDGDWIPRDHSLQQQRNQVRFGFVLFTQSRFRIGAAGVEISKGDAAQPAVTIERSENIFHHQLGFAVRAHRRKRGILWDRRQLLLTIFRENTEDIYAGIEYAGGSPEAQKVLDFIAKEFPKDFKKIRFGTKPAAEDFWKAVGAANFPSDVKVGVGIKAISYSGTVRLMHSAIAYA